MNLLVRQVRICNGEVIIIIDIMIRCHRAWKVHKMFFSTCSMSDTGCLERNLILNRFVDVLCKILKLYVFVNFTGTYANHTTKNDV